MTESRWDDVAADVEGAVRHLQFAVDRA